MIDAAMKIVGNNIRVLFPMAAALVLPFQILTALATISITDDITTNIDEDPNSLNSIKISSAQLGGLGAATVLTLISTVVVTGALTWFIAEYYVGRTPKAGPAIRYAIRRTPATIGSYIVTGVGSILVAIPSVVLIVIGVVASAWPLVVLGAIIAFVAIFWFFIRVSAAVPALIVEKLGPISSVKRSFGLVKGYWWKVFGTLMVTQILIGIVSGVLSSVISGILDKLGGDNEGFRFLWLAIAGTVSAGLTTPVTAAMSVLIYLDLRIRKEGFDLEVLANSLDAPPLGS